VSSDTVNVALDVVPASSLPTTGSAAGTVLSSKPVGKSASASRYNGIAFDNNGFLYVRDATSSNQTEETKLNPITGAVLAGPTLLSSNGQAFLGADLGGCTMPPVVVKLQANVVGRFNSTDQFGLTLTGGGITSNNTATTTARS
jgi:hypothetical protein